MTKIPNSGLGRREGERTPAFPLDFPLFSPLHPANIYNIHIYTNF